MTVAGPPPGLSRAARAYVGLVVASGAVTLVAFFPRPFPDPGLFFFLLLVACVTSAWKVNLPIPLASGSTLSVSFAADVMALLLLGPRAAVLVAAAGVWTQCTVNVKQRYPRHRSVFSTAAEVLTMAATGIVFQFLGGTTGPFAVASLMKPLVGAITAYFCLNTGFVALAIGLSTGRPPWRVWREDFLWSAASFMLAGSAGALAAVVIQRGEQWKAVLMLAPVYLTYRTYQLVVVRLEDQKRQQERLATALAEMEAARASAEAANVLKDQFLATVSHELRTPLNAILGWSDMLCSGILPEPRRAAACEAIFNNAQRQARLIDELLDMARIMSGKLRLERSLVEARDIVNGALETVQPAAEAKGIAITVDLDPAVGTFHGDGTRLQQVLWNLLSNAVKFTPEGGAVRIRVRRRGTAGEIVVSDSGAGISRDFLPAVFEPFRQADGSATRLHGGLGLGLAIVKQLVEAHGGSIDVASAGEGQGATFTVRLPLARAAQFPGQALPSPLVPDEEAMNSLAGLSVLIVDDDEDSRDVLLAYLEAHHATVRIAASASDALALLQHASIDVLLADIAMPGEDGYSLIRKLRGMHASRAATIPAAALTAFAREEDRAAAIRAGFQMHLAKPVDVGSLVAAVATLGRSRSCAG
jgi:signal transduction histidine kinase/ActR/RegA family two-component response regulator